MICNRNIGLEEGVDGGVPSFLEAVCYKGCMLVNNGKKKYLPSSTCGSPLLSVIVIWLFEESGLPAQELPSRLRDWHQSNCGKPDEVEKRVASKPDGLSGGHEDDIEERVTSEFEVWSKGCEDKEAREDEDVENVREKEDTDALSHLNNGLRALKAAKMRASWVTQPP